MRYGDAISSSGGYVNHIFEAWVFESLDWLLSTHNEYSLGGIKRITDLICAYTPFYLGSPVQPSPFLSGVDRVSSVRKQLPEPPYELRRPLGALK